MANAYHLKSFVLKNFNAWEDENNPNRIHTNNGLYDFDTNIIYYKGSTKPLIPQTYSKDKFDSLLLHDVTDQNLLNWHLVYVESNNLTHTLYFMPFKAEQVSGDGWHKKPYNHNSSTPDRLKYEDIYIHTESIWSQTPIFQKKAMVMGDEYDFEITSPGSYDANPNLSIDDITNQLSPWLMINKYGKNSKEIYVNTTYKEIRDIIGSQFYEQYIPKDS